MKRSAAEAFGGEQQPPPLAATAPALPSFQPAGAALFDPKAYFAQWQQASLQGQLAAPLNANATSPALVPVGEKTDAEKELEAVSAVRCAAIVKEKGGNFTTAMSLAALRTMATKSSYKLREELAKQPHVKRLCQRVLALLRSPPPGLSLEVLASAGWCITRFPEEVRGGGGGGAGGGGSYLHSAARALGSQKPSSWRADSAVKVLWSLAKADAIISQRALVSSVVREFVADKGLRLRELSHDSLLDLLWAVTRARQHKHEGDHPTVHTEENDQLLFQLAATRITAEVDQVDVKLLADLCHTHAEVGIRNEGLFKAVCPRIIAKQKELREDAMARVIKAYTRFMIPLKEQPQGFRTMAVVATGDFIRPSEKPKRNFKKQYDHPVALYPDTPLHAKG